jgi:hypothetical protein
MREAPRWTAKVGVATRSVFFLGAAALAAGCGTPALDCELPEVVGTAFTLNDGDAVVSGTISVPPSAPAGRAIEVFVGKGGGSYGVLGDSLFDQQDTCGDSIPFRIEKLEPGDFTISARLQLESGEGEIIYDHVGYYGGTASAPVTDSEKATLITVMEKDTITDIDFPLVEVEPTSEF